MRQVGPDGIHAALSPEGRHGFSVSLFYCQIYIDVVWKFLYNLFEVMDMAQTTLNVRMDSDLKKSLEKFCADVGMNTSVAVNMFAKVVVKSQRLPFEVAVQPYTLTKAELLRRINNLENGGGTIHDIIEAE
jgi:DNA-damage-inducible protein J